MHVEPKQQLSPTHCGGCSGCSIAFSSVSCRQKPSKTTLIYEKKTGLENIASLVGLGFTCRDSIFCSAFSAIIPATLPAMAVAIVAGSCPATGSAESVSSHKRARILSCPVAVKTRSMSVIASGSNRHVDLGLVPPL